MTNKYDKNGKFKNKLVANQRVLWTIIRNRRTLFTSIQCNLFLTYRLKKNRVYIRL